MTKRKKPRPVYDDVGIDAAGRVVAIGEEASKQQRLIIEDPNARPILVIAERDGDIGVRVYGPPDYALADLLDRVAKEYRMCVEMALAKPQG